ncbi:MAG TPA: alpha/beta fold hydrolase, partial [Armatimonadota bacterium]|nr:alpha/beta fold hydrolase [Armatimonadota bacterium]
YYTARIVRMSERMTVKDETIDDALEAVKTLRKIPEIDQKRIFVLGHSLGGMLIPRIAKGNSDIAGVVILAGTTRPLEDVILDQTAYLFSLKNQPGADQSPVEKIRAQVAKVKDKNLSSETPASELPFSIPASYWLDLRDYKPAEAAKHLTQPMLILQGGRDYQVTYLDYDGWKEALVDKKNVTFKLYPKLNHLFVEGEGKSSPDEYDKAGNVAEIVVEDIAAWIKAQ